MMRSLQAATLLACVGVLNGCGVGPSITSVATAPSYTGIVATRGYANGITSFGPTVTWTMNRSFHIAKTDIAAGTLQAVWGNYLSSYGGDSTYGPATYKAAIEYPEGTVTPCTFNKATTITVDAGADALMDPCGPAIPSGATFWVRMLYLNPAGINFITVASQADLTREQFTYGTGTPQDLVNGGSITTTTGGLWMYPYALIGPTVKPSVCVLGDSRAAGLRDAVTDATGDIGEIDRSIGPSFGYTNLAVSGEEAVGAVTQLANRSRLFKYCTHFIDQYGMNDIANHLTANQVVTARTAIAALTGKPTYGTTLPAETTSTDGWVTVANQSTLWNTDTVNSLVRAGIPGEAGYFDVDLGLDPMDLQKFPADTTIDGIHENSAGNIKIRNSGVIQANLLKR